MCNQPEDQHKIGIFIFKIFSMNVPALKSKIVTKVNKLSDQGILEELNLLVDELQQSQNIDFWDELTASQKKSIEVSRKQIAEGKVIPHEQVQQEVKGWLRK